jgi:NAD(P)-dependent dehydrogenase (short-subunit alcohol dehydrogenase family)
MQLTEYWPHPNQHLSARSKYPASGRKLRTKVAGKLTDKVALITNGESGLGRAVAIAYAKAGAKVAIMYRDRDGAASETRAKIEKLGGECWTIKSDLGDRISCSMAVEATVAEFGRLDILVNNATELIAPVQFADLSEEQFWQTMEVSIFGYLYMVKAATPYLKSGSVIINTASVVGKDDSSCASDYNAGKGAIYAFTKALAMNLAKRNIRVNAILPERSIAPSLPPNVTSISHGDDLAFDSIFKDGDRPERLDPAYVFLASADSSFFTGVLLDTTGRQLTANDLD